MVPKKIVVGVTGASGAPYAVRVVQLLIEYGAQVHLAVSTMGRRLLFEESNIKTLCAEQFKVDAQFLVIHNDNDLGSSIASWKFFAQRNDYCSMFK